MNTATLTVRNYRQTLGGSEFRIMRMQDCPTPYAAQTLDTPQRVNDYLRLMLSSSLAYRPDVENFGVVFLSTRCKTIGCEIISNGTLDTVLVHAREVFKPAIIVNASSIVLFHNHPSGDPTPSEADIRFTRELISAGKILRIEVRDHIILGQPSPERSRDYVSLRELGYFYS